MVYIFSLNMAKSSFGLVVSSYCIMDDGVNLVRRFVFAMDGKMINRYSLPILSEALTSMCLTPALALAPVLPTSGGGRPHHDCVGFWYT